MVMSVFSVMGVLVAMMCGLGLLPCMAALSEDDGDVQLASIETGAGNVVDGEERLKLFPTDVFCRPAMNPTRGRWIWKRSSRDGKGKAR